MNRMDKPLARLIKKKGRLKQIKSERKGEVKTDDTEKHMILRDYYSYMPTNGTTQNNLE